MKGYYFVIFCFFIKICKIIFIILKKFDVILIIKLRNKLIVDYNVKYEFVLFRLLNDIFVMNVLIY